MSGPESADAGALLAAPHFHWGSCQLCHKAGTASAPLKRCSRCNLIYYCSQEHQKKHWKHHKKLCSYLSTAADEIGAKCFFSRSEYDDNDNHDEEQEQSDIDPASHWNRFRSNAAKTCQERLIMEVLLGRPLEEWEKEMFLFPKVCRVCRKAALTNTLDCYECMGVTYCSPEHKKQDETEHGEMCKELRFCMAMDTYESTITICFPSIPSELEDAYHGVDGDISEYLGYDGLDKMAPMEEMQHRFLCDRLSGPLTLLHYLHRVGLADRVALQDVEKLVIHVVGADIIEMLGIIKWEYLAHKLPKCRRVRFVFIGPDLADHEGDGLCGLEPCADCSKRKRCVEHEVVTQPYEKFANSAAYSKPDAVVAFNCGFHAYDSWKPAFRAMLWQPDVPLIFSAYNRVEADKDLSLLQESFKQAELCVEVRTEANPFRGHRPFRDFQFIQNKDVFFNNAYVSVVRKTQPN